MIIIRKHHYIAIIGKFVGPYDFCDVENRRNRGIQS